MTMPTYFYSDSPTTVFAYEPRDYMGTLDWFNIARCARERMTDKAGDLLKWRGERRSFYTAILMMNADDVLFMGEG